jgi:N-acetylmuramoyl-L-alanine amidase
MIEDGNVYVSKLKYGQKNSDSVRRLQVRLNEVPPVEATKVVETGNYDDPTDAAVRAWQKSIGDTPDSPKQSFLGPKQSELIFKDSGNTVINDTAGTTLGNYLKSKGNKVVDSNVPMGREAAWDKVEWILVHHTASPDSWSEQQTADFIKFGREYPPLSQIMLGKSGTVWICSQQRAGQSEPGRATHAGAGIWPGVPQDRMNEFSIGIEAQNNGKTQLKDTPAQYTALIKLLVDLCNRYKIDETKILGHKEWSTTGKIDPLDNMNKIRADVKYALAGVDNPVTPPQPPVTPPTPPSGVEVGMVALWEDYSGKPAGNLILAGDGDWTVIDTVLEDPKIAGSEHHMSYTRLSFEWKPLPTVDSFDEAMRTVANYAAKVEIKYVRDDGDATAYDERHYSYGTKSVPFQQLHFESGEVGKGGKWFMKVHGGVKSMTISTRYAKAHTIGVIK